MAVQTTVASSSVVEILDRILDKGIVIDAWVSVSVIGIELVTIEARVIVASVETYVRHARLLKEIGPIAKGTRRTRTLGENIRELEKGVEGIPIAGDILGGGQEQEREKIAPSRTKAESKATGKTSRSRVVKSKRGRARNKK